MVERPEDRHRPRPAHATILHVDMDAFYAAVELLVDPSLAGRPVIVGGAGNRGVVASCSYEARGYGIHSAMPSTQARRLCPAAVFVPGHYDLYADYSRRLHAIFAEITPLVEGIALDEAFLDVTGARRLLGTGPEIATLVRRRISDELLLAASVGVAPSKLLAKLASKAAKPRATRQGPRPGPGVVVVEPGGELAFLHPLPVHALWGVGPATRDRLDRFGVRTIGDLAQVPVDSLVRALGKAQGRHLHDLSWGIDERPVEPDRAVKSIGHEETYARDLHDHEALTAEAVRLADSVASRLRKAGVAGRTVTIKVRFHDFATITRSQTLPTAVDTGPAIARAASALLAAVDPTSGVRLFGVSLSNLDAGGARQLSLDDVEGPGWQEASTAVDAVRRRFGDRSLGPAALVGEGGLRVKRQGDAQWGPTGRTDR
jgi:DNA polymerase-4